MQAAQSAGSSGPPAPPERPPSGQAQQWRTWQHADNDRELRQQLTQHIYTLFSQRQKSSMQAEWFDKMPDFVRRLEEALYRTANSKEEYGDPATLEYRLQNIARRMVSTNGQRRFDGARPQAPGAQGAHQQQQQQPAQTPAQPAAGPPQANGGPQLGPPPPASGAQPDFQQQAGAAFSPPASGGVLASGPMASQPMAPGVQPLRSQAPAAFGSAPMPSLRPLGSPQVNGLPGSSMAPNGLKLEQPGMVPLGMQGLDGMQPQLQPSGLGRGPGGGNGVMSNGAPVMLRGSRDAWAPGQSPMLPNGLSNGPMNPGSKITINGMAPGQLGGGMQGGLPTMSLNGGPMLGGQQQPRSPALRSMGPGSLGMGGGGGGMVPMSNGMIPTMPGQPGLGGTPMVPLNMPGQPMGSMPGDMRRPGSAGMVPVSGGGMAGMVSLHTSSAADLGPQLQPGGGSRGSGGGLPQMNGGLAGDAPGNAAGPGSLQAQGDAAADAEFVSKLHSQNREYVAKQQRWLLFLRHCAKCTAKQGECQYGQSCTVAKALWRHILQCANPQCQYPRCVTSRELLKHHQKCQSNSCPVCTPVKQYVQKQRLALQQQAAQQQHARAAQMQQQQGGPLSLEQARVSQGMAAMSGALHAPQRQHMMQRGMAQQAHYGGGMGMYGGGGGMFPGQGGHAPLPGVGVRRSAAEMSGGMPHPAEPASKRYHTVISNENRGTSLLEAFGLEEIHGHLRSLRAGAAAAQQRSGYGLPPPNLADPNACSACGGTRLTFEPAAVYCSACVQKIKRNQVFYATSPKTPEVKGNWCHACFIDEKKDTLELEGMRVRKADLVKRRNDEEQEEAWVACDQCNRWVHQICGLFNKGRNNEDVPYICPDCLARGLEMGIRKPIEVRPQAMLEAKDLPTCELSDFIEERLRATVAEDRQLRAQRQGLPPHQVQGAEGLTVRVVNNISKKMEVKPKFLETFRHEGYPDTFPYKQKVIVLFQRINGVDVALYCLYMQEYGDDCPAPDRRWVYLSYLDSVKYFEPEIPSASRPGIALRTLVYHDILLSYLDYIKRRGYCSMFIWACPPFQGDDYILHCHPSRQKLPRSDRLREWYLAMLRVAKERGTVAHLSNLFDTFFEGGRDHRERATAAAMPYLDGDYWPGEAENLLSSINEEARVAAKKSKKAAPGAAKGTVRPGKKGKRHGGLGSVDEQLMAKLGETVQGMKEDFIVVHLREPCSCCRAYISEGNRWVHPAPPGRVVMRAERSFEGINLDQPGAGTKSTAQLTRFQMCHACYERERTAAPGQPSRLPAGIALGDLRSERAEPIPPTHDPNPDVSSEFFDTRQAFLSLCQGNHYQFDTLRRARHSSMMVLYHLHNPDAPAFASSCNHCQREIEPGAGFRCPQCADFDLCAACKAAGVLHPHPLMANVRSVNETQVRLTSEQQADRKAQLQRTMNLLVHASACQEANCPSSNCSKVKGLFAHAVQCQQKVSGGCQLCRRMWALLQVHAKQCQEQSCPVPRCRELREMRRRQVARQEAQRRSGYQQMLRKQAAAGGGGGGGAIGPAPEQPGVQPPY